MRIRPRVGFLIGQLAEGDLGPCGSEKQLFLLLSAIDIRIIEPILIVWNPDLNGKYDSAFPQVQTIFLKRSKWRVLRIYYLWKCLRDFKVDFLQTWSFYLNFPAWVAAKLAGLKGSLGSVKTNFLLDLQDMGPISGRLCTRFPGSIISNNDAALENIKRRLRLFRPKHLWKLSNVVDTELYRPSVRTGSSPLKIIGVGRLMASKRWPWVLEIFSRISKEVEIDWTFDIFGQGDQQLIIEQKIIDLGLSKNVRLAGYRTDIHTAVAESDIFVFGSESEGMPNGVLEAMSAGLPVVTTDVGDLASLIEDGENGFLVRIDDAKGFQERLLALMQSRQVRIQMGAAARRSIEASHSHSRVFSDLLGIYRSAGWLRTDLGSHPKSSDHP